MAVLMKRAPAAILILLLVVVPGAVTLLNRSAGAEQEIVIWGRMPEAGGWSRETIELEVGEPATFRLSSADVVHGFAIGHVDLQAVDVEPGKWTEFRWRPDAPGEYRFYCTRWCGVNHWRMTGTILVSDPEGALPTATLAPAPRFQVHGVDLDNRPDYASVAGIELSAVRGAALDVSPEVEWRNEADGDLTTPTQAWERLRHDPSLQELSDRQLWDLLAYIWTSEAGPAPVDAGEQIYRSNCAACHGPLGAGDGVMAMHFEDPPVADFTALERMATASSVLIEGKILRGGMGTGMPYWGGILTQQQIDAVVDYVWWLTLAGE